MLPRRLLGAAKDHRLLVQRWVPGQAAAARSVPTNLVKLRLPVVQIVGSAMGREKAYTAISTGDSQDKSEVLGRKLDVLNWGVDVGLPGHVPGPTRQNHVLSGLFLTSERLLVDLPVFTLFKDEDLLVHPARGQDLAEVRVCPGDAPNRPVVLAPDLKGADPLIRQHHLVGELVGHLRL